MIIRSHLGFGFGIGFGRTLNWFDSLTVFRIYIGIFNYSTFWMYLGSFYGPRFYKNVLDTDFQTFGLFIRGFQRRDIVKDCWIHLFYNISKEHMHSSF